MLLIEIGGELMKNNIKVLREQSGMSQKALATTMGVSQQAVSKWETGASLPLAEQLPKLADLFHCTIDALFGREQNTA